MRAVLTVISRICSFLGWTLVIIGAIIAALLLFTGEPSAVFLSLSYFLVSAALIGALRKWRRKAIGLALACIVLALVPAFTGLRVDPPTRFTHETAAIKAILTVQSAQKQYQSQYGHFAESLAELGPPVSAGPSAAAADLIGKNLASGERAGYRLTLTGDQAGYVIHANPVKFGVTGTRTFYSDQTMELRENYGPEPATASSKSLK
jgi:hypothetical protein